MNRFTKLPVALVLFCTITLFSCSKDDDKSKTELITSGTWKITAFTSNPAVDWDGDGDTETDIYGSMEACEKDNITTFKSDGTAQDDEGATKCDSDDPQITSFEWSFTNNESKIMIDGYEYTIVELNSTTLKIKESYTTGPVTVYGEITFGH